MAFTPYLAFPGTAREAFTFYHEVFGGEVNIMSMSDMPPGSDVPPGMENAVMHADLVFAGGTLMGADGPPDVVQTGMCSMYHQDDESESLRVFAALAEGGTVVDAHRADVLRSAVRHLYRQVRHAVDDLLRLSCRELTGCADVALTRCRYWPTTWHDDRHVCRQDQRHRNP